MVSGEPARRRIPSSCGFSSSIASVIGVTELNGAALTVNAREFHPLEILTFLGLPRAALCGGGLTG